MKIHIYLATLGLFAVLVAGCGGSSSSRAPVNTAPTINAVPDQSIDANVTSAAIAFTAADNDTSSLVFSVSSDNQPLVPDAGLDLVSDGAAGSVMVTPVVDLLGDAQITITVTDQGGLSASTSFLVTVNAQQVSLQQFVRNEFMQTEDGSPVPINAIVFIQDAEDDDFADLLAP